MNGRRLNRGSYTHSVHVNRNDRWRGTKKLCKYNSNEIKESIEKNRTTARILVVSILRHSKRKLCNSRNGLSTLLFHPDIEIIILRKTAVVEFLLPQEWFYFYTKQEFMFKQRNGWWKLHDKKINGNYTNRKSVK